MNIKVTIRTAYSEELADPTSQEYKDLSTTLISEFEEVFTWVANDYFLTHEIKGVTFTPPARRRRGGSDGTNAVVTYEFTSHDTDINAAILNGFASYRINQAIARGQVPTIDKDQEAVTLTKLKGKNTSLNHYLTQCVPNQESIILGKNTGIPVYTANPS